MVAHYQLTSQQPQLQAMASRFEVHGPNQFKIRSWYRQLFCFPNPIFLIRRSDSNRTEKDVDSTTPHQVSNKQEFIRTRKCVLECLFIFKVFHLFFVLYASKYNLFPFQVTDQVPDWVCIEEETFNRWTWGQVKVWYFFQVTFFATESF